VRGLRVTSLQAPIADPLCRQLTDYLAQRLGRPMHFVDDEPWQARERRLDDGEIDVAWICGLPYVLRRDRPSPTAALLAAAVMAHPRYQDRPIYFSDVVVREESPLMILADLKGTRWAYNEPSSHSGYCLTRCELARAGHASGFFASATEAGSHQIALELLLRGEIDATALDSTVLDAMVLQRPALREELRVIETWGPSPIPPWIVSSHVPEDTRARLQEAGHAIRPAVRCAGLFV
jgi:phosphonate transport system substrate-binding protein